MRESTPRLEHTSVHAVGCGGKIQEAEPRGVWGRAWRRAQKQGPVLLPDLRQTWGFEAIGARGGAGAGGCCAGTQSPPMSPSCLVAGKLLPSEPRGWSWSLLRSKITSLILT